MEHAGKQEHQVSDPRADILNQSRNLRRTVSAEYVEDVYSNILGRFFLFSVSFNFGKMNAKKNKNVEGAMWNMM